MFDNNKGFTPLGQLGILLAMTGAGLVLGGIISVAVMLMGGVGMDDLQEAMSNPAHLGKLQFIQFFSTLTSFFIPAVAFAFICFRKGWDILGFRWPLALKVVFFSVLIILAAGPLIDSLTQLNRAIPIGAELRAFFDNMEAKYEEQVKVLGAVNSFPQYLLALVIIAMLPAVFEETLFRGALQGIFMRWFRNPWAAIIVTGFLFSAIHFSWYGFLPRWALGIQLGLIYHYTGSVWYAIIVHFFNNALVVTYMYYSSLKGQPLPESSEVIFPWWAGIISLAVIVFLFQALRKAVGESGRYVSAEESTDYNQWQNRIE